MVHNAEYYNRIGFKNIEKFNRERTERLKRERTERLRKEAE
jgi:hypothetical protein